MKDLQEQCRTLGQRVADRVASAVGSWPFVIGQSLILCSWFLYNGDLALRYFHHRPFDPFPFILLNLVLSFQAAYTGPLVMISQNRQGAKDRLVADRHFQLDQATQAELAELRGRFDELLARLDATRPRVVKSRPGEEAGERL